MSVEAKLTYQLDEATLKRAIKLMREYGNEADLTKRDINELERELEQMGKASKKNTSSAKKDLGALGGAGKKVGKILLAAFAADQLLEFGKKVVETTAKFEKLAAVLENSLGSKSAAQIAMREIQIFAAKTNFSVGELTGAYVKLVNQGFKPTMTEMRKMADVANSTGKDMDMLAEAILDAQVGEFERLKEFGIRASKQGDKVKFTFKGVTKEVKFTTKAIQQYLVSLGDVEGVSGSTEKISKTLGGAISNMGDSFEKLLVTLGSIGSPIIIKGIETLSAALSGIADTLITDDQKSFNRAVEKFKELGGEGIKLNEAQKILNQLRNEENQILEENIALKQEAATDIQQSTEAQEALFALEKAKVKGLKEEADEQKKILDNLSDNLKLQEILTDLIAKQRKDAAKKVKVDINTIDAVESLKEIDTAVQGVEEALKRMGEQVVQIPAQTEEALEEALAKWLDYKNHVADVQSGLLTLTGEFTNSIFEIQRERREEELEALNEERDERLRLVGSNEEAQHQVKEEYANRERQLLAEQARARRNQFLFNQLEALGQVWINTGLAVAKSIAVSPITFGEPWATYARVQGAINAGIIGAQSLPALFAEGTERVTGAGGEKDDKIPARLSLNERVVDADKNRRIGFDMSNEDLARAAEFYRAIPGQLRGDLWQMARGGQAPIDTDALADKITGPITRTIKSQPIANLYLDGHGLGVNVQRQQNHLAFLEKRFGIRIRN